MTDLVAFGISLSALSSFCAYAAICIIFLWLFASTFFSAAMMLDERKQRDNRREILCCLTRAGEVNDETYQEGFMPKYFRNNHAPAILSRVGKVVVLILFSGLLAFGVYGAVNLSVEDTGRRFVPSDSYLQDFIDTTDEFFSDQSMDLYITFEGSSEIYSTRQELADLETRLTGLSTAPPYISEPDSEEAYRNVMDGFGTYLASEGTDAIGGAPLGDDNWPTSEPTLRLPWRNTPVHWSRIRLCSRCRFFSEDGTKVDALRVKLEYVKLTKTSRGEVIDDADKQIDAMEETRDMVASRDDLPPAFPYSEEFTTIEGFIVIRKELFLKVGLAIVVVGIIAFFTVASLITSLLITLSVASCICGILGFMWAIGIAIDSVSVINLVLAVGISVDYSAHVGHCFMVKGGSDKNKRVTESLADIGSAVLQGATSTFLAVVVLLFSSSYVFETLSRQFVLTVVCGVLHGLVLLPVLLSLVGSKPFSSAELPESEDEKTNKLGVTAHQDSDGVDGSSESEEAEMSVEVEENPEAGSVLEVEENAKETA